MDITLDVGHVVLLAVVAVLVVRGLAADVLARQERSALVNKLMARSLAEYTKSEADLARIKNGDPTEDEEDEIFRRRLKEDRIPV